MLPGSINRPIPGRNGSSLKSTRQSHELGQTLWLHNINRSLLDDETLAHDIGEDLRRAADLFTPGLDATDWVDGVARWPEVPNATRCDGTLGPGCRSVHAASRLCMSTSARPCCAC